eukprot:GEMP01025000.1.p1 GENE.GEMP01025000.1~~GEMP01025000.1.p1  ORF type:complete len:363 (+),score=76.79 GEMP01025000.1:102-1091(+)
MAKADDPRMGALIGKEPAVLSLILWPFDEGCVRNGGRPGAKSGPHIALEHIRKTGALHNVPYMGKNAQNDGDYIDLTEYGIAGPHWIAPGTSLEDAHANLRVQVYKDLKESRIPFIIGGGNDQSWPNAEALLMAKPSTKVGVINIDAHFDVRPLLDDGKMHSGAPFRMLLESEAYEAGNIRFVEFAAQGQQCSKAHVDYLVQKGAQILWMEHLRWSKDPHAVKNAFRDVLTSLRKDCELIFVSFDIDSIRQSDVPCVSCPSPLGMSSEEAIDIMFLAGKEPKVGMVDVSEFNPEVCTAMSYNVGRLVANMLYHFILGRAEHDKRENGLL